MAKRKEIDFTTAESMYIIPKKSSFISHFRAEKACTVEIGKTVRIDIDADRFYFIDELLPNNLLHDHIIIKSAHKDLKFSYLELNAPKGMIDVKNVEYKYQASGIVFQVEGGFIK